MTKCKRLGEVLVDRGYISEPELQEALRHQKKSEQKLGHVLVSCGFLLESHLKKVLVEHKQYRIAELKNFVIPPELRQIFPQRLAEQHHVVPLELKEGFSLILAMEDPEDLELIKTLQKFTHLYIEPVFAGFWEIQNCLVKNYYETPGTDASLFEKLQRCRSVLTFDVEDVKAGDDLFERLMNPLAEDEDDEESREDITQETSHPAQHYFPKDA